MASAVPVDEGDGPRAFLGGGFSREAETAIGLAFEGEGVLSAAERRSQSSEACIAEGSSIQLTLSREIVMRREGRL
jgi:hypothetical protein